jgi:hypothetical protein
LASLEKKNFANFPFSHIPRTALGREMPRACAGYAARRDYRLCEAVSERPIGNAKRHGNKRLVGLLTVELWICVRVSLDGREEIPREFKP